MLATLKTTLIHALKEYLPGIVMLLLLLVIGAVICKDYGASWDEPQQKNMGEVSYNYAFKGDKELFTYPDRDHGVGFELPLVMSEIYFVKSTNSRHEFLARHLTTHIYFILACFCGYVLVQQLFKNQFLSCLGFILFVFDPRLFAHSFFNSKDIPFLSSFLISLTACYFAFYKNKPAWYILLGLTTGYCSSIRLLNIFFIFFVCLFFLFDFIQAVVAKKPAKSIVIHFVLFTVYTLGTLYVFWPLMWSNPVHNFLEVLERYSHYNWYGTLFFFGHFEKAYHLPYMYLPIWIGITTPIIVCFGAVIGCVWLLFICIRKPMALLTDYTQRNILLYLLCLLTPVTIVISQRTVMYDDWRHLYYLYPLLVLLSLFTINRLMKTKLRPLIILLSIIQVLDLAVFMVRFHPNQQVYFNSLISHKKEYLKQNFELDYWGVSFKQGLEYILSHDTSSVIKITCEGAPLTRNLRLLKPEQQKRFQHVWGYENTNYLFTNFRNTPNEGVRFPVFYEQSVLNSPIMRVYKLH